MELKSYLKAMATEADREAFAVSCETSLGHLRNICNGSRQCATDLAVRIERKSRGAVTRQELREDWADHWPELVKQTATAGQG